MLIINTKMLQKENERTCSKGLKRRLAIIQGDKVLKEFKTNEIKEIRQEVKTLRKQGFKKIDIVYIFRNNKEVKHKQIIGFDFNRKSKKSIDNRKTK